MKWEPKSKYSRVATLALLAGVGIGLSAMPLGNLAFAKGNGDHGHGGSGGGNGAGHGNSSAHGNGAEGGPGNKSSADIGGPGQSGADQAAIDTRTGDDDASLSASGLGKLNGFFHASPQALANASPNSSIGRLSHAFKDALDAYAAAGMPSTDPNAPAPTGPTLADLGGILAGATNKTVTPSQVKAIIEHLAQTNPDDTALGGLAASVDDATCQGIASAANGAGSTTTVVSDGGE